MEFSINEQITKKRQNLSKLLNSIEEFKDNFEIISYGEKTVFASKDFSKHFEIKNTKTSIYNYDESTIILIEEFNSEKSENEEKKDLLNLLLETEEITLFAKEEILKKFLTQ